MKIVIYGGQGVCKPDSGCKHRQLSLENEWWDENHQDPPLRCVKAQLILPREDLGFVDYRLLLLLTMLEVLE